MRRLAKMSQSKPESVSRLALTLQLLQGVREMGSSPLE